MKPILTIFAILLLSACTPRAEQNIGFEEFKAERPIPGTLNHENLQLAQSSINDVEAAELNAEAVVHQTDGKSIDDFYTQEERNNLSAMIDHLEQIHQDVVGIWNEDFSPLKRKYQWAALTSSELAPALESLHESYNTLEMELDGMQIPEYLKPVHAEYFEQLKSDLGLAISNRTLALIEFKLMNQEEEYDMNETMFEVHMGNSRKYMSNAADTINHLENLESAFHDEDRYIVTEK
ncbi:hypothetical protein [Salinicoccus sp. CNSTN-B1]